LGVPTVVALRRERGLASAAKRRAPAQRHPR
jgi:hypothetical protein